MGMIRRSPAGRYFCDGRECGYPLQWLDGDGGEEVVCCLDCGAAMSATRPLRTPTNQQEGR